MHMKSRLSYVTQEICTIYRHSLERTEVPKQRRKKREHLQTRELGLGKRLCVLMECRRKQKNCLHCGKAGEIKVLTHVKGMAAKA